MALAISSPARADDALEPKLPAAGEPDLIDAQDPAGRQNELTDLKTWIISLPGLSTSGYIESVNYADTLSTTLLWKGPADDVQREIISEGRRRGITVNVEQRKFGREEIVEAVDTLSASSSTALKGFRVNSVLGVTADFDGVRVFGEYTAPVKSSKTTSRVAAERTAVNDVAEKAAEQVGVDVRIESGGEYATAAATRVDDSAPYNAGGLMVSPQEDSACSTGFSVKVGGTPYTMTARHCTAHDYKVYRDSDTYGDGVRNSTDGAARQMSKKGSPLMFDGAYNNTDGYKKTVVGYGDVSLNDKVCTSGANSGVHCSLNIQAMGAMISDGYPHVPDPRFSAILAGHVTNGTAACQGDSGGPVLMTAGTGKVKAVGMIQAINTTPAYRTNPARWFTSGYCSVQVYFTSMRTIVNTLPNASLVTGD